MVLCSKEGIVKQGTTNVTETAGGVMTKRGSGRGAQEAKITTAQCALEQGTAMVDCIRQRR